MMPYWVTINSRPQGSGPHLPVPFRIPDFEAKMQSPVPKGTLANKMPSLAA
jgi:hypothetical protein